MGLNLTTNNSSLARWNRRRASRHVSGQSPIVVGGCQRSGTTLLRVILDAHPHIACSPESSLFPGSYLPEKLAKRLELPLAEVKRLKKASKDHAHFIELFMTEYARRRGKQRWSEKTPQNIRHVDYVFRHFPKAKFVHVFRDGRDVICSIRTHPRHRMVDGKKVATNIRRPIEPCIECWLQDTAAGLAWRGHPNFYELRYEELVADPEGQLRKLCAFVGEPWSGAMLEHYQQQRPELDPSRFVTPEATEPLTRKSIERWRRDLTAAELELFYERAGHRLEELGYARHTGAAPLTAQPQTS